MQWCGLCFPYLTRKLRSETRSGGSNGQRKRKPKLHHARNKAGWNRGRTEHMAISITGNITMIRNADTARQISDLMHEVFRRLDESTQLVKSTCSAEDFADYNKSIGRVLGAVVMDVMEPLYTDNPTLKPRNWDSPPWKSN